MGIKVFTWRLVGLGLSLGLGLCVKAVSSLLTGALVLGLCLGLCVTIVSSLLTGAFVLGLGLLVGVFDIDLTFCLGKLSSLLTGAFDVDRGFCFTSGLDVDLGGVSSLFVGGIDFTRGLDLSRGLDLTGTCTESSILVEVGDGLKLSSVCPVGTCAGPGLVFPLDIPGLVDVFIVGLGFLLPGLMDVFIVGLGFFLPGLVNVFIVGLGFPLPGLTGKQLSNCLFNQSRPLLIASSAT